MIVDFSPLHTKLLLGGLITQTILPFNEETRGLKKGEICRVSFEGLIFNDYSLRILNVSVTDLKKLSNKDISNNGFLYKPFFLEYMDQKGMTEESTILKIDFELVEN